MQQDGGLKPFVGLDSGKPNVANSDVILLHDDSSHDEVSNPSKIRKCGIVGNGI